MGKLKFRAQKMYSRRIQVTKFQNLFLNTVPSYHPFAVLCPLSLPLPKWRFPKSTCFCRQPKISIYYFGSTFVLVMFVCPYSVSCEYAKTIWGMFVYVCAFSVYVCIHDYVQVYTCAYAHLDMYGCECVCIWMHVCVYIWMYIVHVWMCVCMSECTCICMWVYMYLYICMRLCLCMCTCVCMCAHATFHRQQFLLGCYGNHSSKNVKLNPTPCGPEKPRERENWMTDTSGGPQLRQNHGLSKNSTGID